MPLPKASYQLGAFMIQTLSIDIETYSSADLAKAGTYRYVESDDFRVLLFGYSIDHGPIEVVDLEAGEAIPSEVIKAIRDKSVIKWAFNASFERVCISRMLGMKTGEYLDPTSWRCSMIWSAYLGLPMSLEMVGEVLGLGKQKMKEGKALIRRFCRPTQSGRILPSSFPDEWTLFKDYNRRDVETEMAIQDRLSPFPVPDSVWKEYADSEIINDRGVLVDLAMAKKVIDIDRQSSADISARLREITGLENPNSAMQMKAWLADNGLEVETLDRKEVAELAANVKEELREPLQLRLKLAKSSIRKYDAMLATACSDARARGMFQFYGSHTGRWAGRHVQLQNLPQNHISDLAGARDDVMRQDYDALTRKYDDVPDILSQLVRTAFIPSEGMKFIVADYSAIEARVVSWYAGEEWRLEVFRHDGDIYSETASRMFGVHVAKHGPNAELRQKGKRAELACGYGGSVGAIKAMGAVEMGIPEEELRGIVDAWRKANPAIVRFWWDVDRAAKTAIRNRRPVRLGRLVMSDERGILFIQLPSGRKLAYQKAAVGLNRFGGEGITHLGVDGTTRKWRTLETYGPKLVENIVQATSRDILAHAIGLMKALRVVMHIHDEIVVEAPVSMKVDDIVQIMTTLPSWADGLPLSADGYECPFYRKD